jgi:hypothetical protein
MSSISLFWISKVITFLSLVKNTKSNSMVLLNSFSLAISLFNIYLISIFNDNNLLTNLFNNFFEFFS